MSIFLYGIEVWGCAFESKYISRIDKFCKRAFRSGYIVNYFPFVEVIRKRDFKLWEKITTYSNHCRRDLLTMQRKRKLRDGGHNYILPRIRTERFKTQYINRCLFNFL